MMFPLTFEQKIPLKNNCFYSMKVSLEAGNIETIALSLFLGFMNHRKTDRLKRKAFSFAVEELLWSDEFQCFMNTLSLKIFK